MRADASSAILLPPEAQYANPGEVARPRIQVEGFPVGRPAALTSNRDPVGDPPEPEGLPHCHPAGCYHVAEQQRAARLADDFDFLLQAGVPVGYQRVRQVFQVSARRDVEAHPLLGDALGHRVCLRRALGGHVGPGAGADAHRDAVAVVLKQPAGGVGQEDVGHVGRGLVRIQRLLHQQGRPRAALR